MKYPDKIKVECGFCKTAMFVQPYRLKIKNKTGHLFCNRSCKMNYLNKNQFIPKRDSAPFFLDKTCKHCQKAFKMRTCELEKTLARGRTEDYVFCSRSCATTYRNIHTKPTYNRSKLESWLEIQLKNLYPNLFIVFNDRKTIGLELDIYLPSLHLAFELNGKFHYEPIFGTGTLKFIQNKDGKKFHLCVDKQIDLCVIDTTIQKNFTEKSSQQFLDIIIKLINDKLSG